MTVQLNDAVYTGRSSADIPWNFDPTQLAVDQKLGVCANNTLMVLDRWRHGLPGAVCQRHLQPRRETQRVIEDERTARAASSGCRLESAWFQTLTVFSTLTGSPVSFAIVAAGAGRDAQRNSPRLERPRDDPRSQYSASAASPFFAEGSLAAK